MDGMKTYLATAVMALFGAGELAGVPNLLPDDAGIMTIGYALAIAALRHGIAKAKVK